jgi:hypothetical protein
MIIEHTVRATRPATHVPDVAAFARRALGMRFEMRFQWETEWWPVDAQDVGLTLSGYYDSMHSCLEQMREGKELPSGLAYFRVCR